MRRLRLSALKTDMVIGRTIRDSDGRILLQAGVKLNENYIRRLADKGIASVYIKDGVFDNEDLVRDVVSEKTRQETVKVAKESFHSLENRRSLNINKVKNVVNNIIDDLLSNHDILIHLSDIRCFDDYTFCHSVNVCVLAVITGITMGYQEHRLKELGIGALLHDIGKTRVDKEILNKPGDLSPEEFDEIKQHTTYGFNILREYMDISLLSAHIAFQHHERWDGQGYPRGLSGTEIHEYARIVAAADIYDALLADRPYRPAYSINQALNILERMSGTHLDPDCILALRSNVAIYPIGSFVELTTGDIGLVVAVNKTSPSRPRIKVIFDSHKRPISNPREIDLARMSTIMIAKPLDTDDIPMIS